MKSRKNPMSPMTQGWFDQYEIGPVPPTAIVPIVRRNPFYVTPKGQAQYVSEDEAATLRRQSKIPRMIEREGLLEGQSMSLPEGYEVREMVRGGQGIYAVFYMGQDTGKYGLDPRKAAEIISRMKDGKVTSRAPRAGTAKNNPRSYKWYTR